MIDSAPIDNPFMPVIVPISDEMVEAYEQDQERKALDRKIKNAVEETEKLLRAPEHYTLQSWNDAPGAKAKICGADATLKQAIVELLNGRSGIIAGPTRSGKSHLANAIARERAKRGYTGCRTKDFELAIEADVNRFRRSEKYEMRVREAVKCGTWVFDDAGKKRCYVGDDTTPYGDLIFSILDDRVEFGRQTIITTRFLDAATFTERMGADMVARFQGRDRDGRVYHVSIVLD